LRADRFGIFKGRLHAELGSDVRAVQGRVVSGSVPVAPIDDHFYNPFGTTPPLESG
jgi:hypothetical protein